MKHLALLLLLIPATAFARAPVVAPRPHTVTLVSVENYTTNSRMYPRVRRDARRIVLDISPPLAGGERYRFVFNLGRDYEATKGTVFAFGENGHRLHDQECVASLVRPELQPGGFYISSDDFLVIESEGNEVYGIEMIVGRHPEGKGEGPIGIYLIDIQGRGYPH